MTDLAEIRAGWDTAAKEDAFFNILTSPGKEGGGWDQDEFFARGETEIGLLMEHLDGLGLPERHDRALDFGCGVGRLTKALASRFKAVDGVDVSGAMVSRARALCGNGRCRFWPNPEPDLKLLGRRRYDLVYSVITLQHLPPELQEGYVREFVRVLHKGGVAVFQVPEGDRYDHPQPWLSMYGTSRETVEGWLAGTDGRLVATDDSEHGGDGWRGYRYTVVK